MFCVPWNKSELIKGFILTVLQAHRKIYPQKTTPKTEAEEQMEGKQLLRWRAWEKFRII